MRASPPWLREGQTKTPPGELRGGVIAARTRKGGSTFDRANWRDHGTKGRGPSVRFATREPGICGACLISARRVSHGDGDVSAPARVWPVGDARVLRDAQHLVQVRFVKDVPQPADHF